MFQPFTAALAREILSENLTFDNKNNNCSSLYLMDNM
jgi:hypothetical protein